MLRMLGIGGVPKGTRKKKKKKAKAKNPYKTA